MNKLGLLFFMLLAFGGYSQNYDLIVTKLNDSIACNIDSVNKSKIFFEYKINGQWVYYSLRLIDCKSYSYDTIDKKSVVFKGASTYIDYIVKAEENKHSDRYIFAPSAYGLKKGELKYSTYFFAVHDFNYGFTDYFSMGVGTSIIGNPVYLMPSFHFNINDKSSWAVGDLFLYPTIPDLFPFGGNLLYGMYTRGSANKNFSMGVGLWSTFENDKTAKGMSPAVTMSGLSKISPKWYFVTENYGFQMIMKELANFYDDQNYFIDAEHFESKTILLAGMSGFRFIPRKKPQNCWQFAMIYIFSFYEDVPDKYYTEPGWEVYLDDDNASFVMTPVFSFTHRF